MKQQQHHQRLSFVMTAAGGRAASLTIGKHSPTVER
jgi:hypothetical protein